MVRGYDLLSFHDKKPIIHSLARAMNPCLLALGMLALVTHGLSAAPRELDRALTAAARSGNSSGVLSLLYHGAQPDGFIDEGDEGASVCDAAKHATYSCITLG